MMLIRSMSSSRMSQPTSRGSSRHVLGLDWIPRSLPADAVVRNAPLRAADGAATGGALYKCGRPKTVVCLMHPREFFAFHYLIPDILVAGAAAWAQLPRSVGLDVRLEHETALFDVAAGLSFLRDQGFERIVLLGNSGGSGLYSLYVQQSGLPPDKRIARTPAGRPTGLADLAMPLADAMIYVAPHPGQGCLLAGCIDPSVTDEANPLSVDPALDAFDPRNGYADPPAPARYASEFVEHYRHAQTERVRRLDLHARALIEDRMAARKRSKESADPSDRRRGAHTSLMTVWRTDADLRCLDLSIDPSDRAYGSVWGSDLVASNYGAVGFARTLTPEAWLSTWSGLVSNATLEKTAPAVTVPTLLIEYTGDQTTFPSVIRDIYGWIGATDKTHVRIRGDHHGRSLSPGEEPGRDVAGRAVQHWMRQRFS